MRYSMVWSSGVLLSKGHREGWVGGLLHWHAQALSQRGAGHGTGGAQLVHHVGGTAEVPQTGGSLEHFWVNAGSTVSGFVPNVVPPNRRRYKGLDNLNVVEAHCYVVPYRWIEHEQWCSRINQSTDWFCHVIAHNLFAYIYKLILLMCFTSGLFLNLPDDPLALDTTHWWPHPFVAPSDDAVTLVVPLTSTYVPFWPTP